jgi:hypothetical protein
MAWFDLKNADIYLVDGFSGAAAVNLMAGYTMGATTMTIDGYTGIIPTGITFNVVGSTAVHTITSHTETMGNTTSITFTPGITGAVADNAVITLLPRQLKIKIGEGNLTYSEKRSLEYKKDRGKIDTVRLGDEEPVDVSFEFWWEFLKASTGLTPTIEDVLKNRGEASNWKSTAPDSCEPYAIDVVVVYNPICTNVEKEKIVLNMFRYESLNHDLKAGQISCSGKCNVKEATVSRASTF